MINLDQPMSKALEKDGYNRFLESLRTAGLEDYLDEQNNITLFVPTNEAMEKFDREILRSPSKLREILLYHIATPEAVSCDFSNEQVLPTKLNNQNIRMNLYSHVSTKIQYKKLGIFFKPGFFFSFLLIWISN